MLSLRRHACLEGESLMMRSYEERIHVRPGRERQPTWSPRSRDTTSVYMHGPNLVCVLVCPGYIYIYIYSFEK